MSDIGAPLTTGSPVAVAAEARAVALGQVTLSQIPNRLSLLTRPVLLSGTVTTQGNDGTTVLRTQAGAVAFNTTVPLPAETPVTLQINAGQPPTTANAFVTAPPPAGPLPALALTSTAPAVTTTLGALAQAALAGAENGLSSVSPDTLIPGHVLPPGGRASNGTMPPPGNAPTGGAQPLVPGTTVAVRIVPTAPAPALVQGVPPLEPSEPSEMFRGAGLSLPTAPSTTAPSTVPPSPAPSTLSEKSPAFVTVTGTITGTTASGQPILTTALGTLALTTSASLPPGKSLTVQISDPRPLFADRSPPTATAPQAWPPIRDAMAVLTGQEGALAQAALMATLPQPNRRLAAALTFTIDSVRRGDARGWLGAEASEALEKADRHDLLSALDKDFKTQARQADDTQPGGWRSLMIPMLDAGLLQQLELYVRAVGTDEREEQDGGSVERGQRFLLDLTLSRLGALQLDGLVRSKSKRFDLILRSLEPLPESLRRELLGVCGKSLEAVGYAGGIGFQTGARSWVKPGVIAKTSHQAVIA